MVSFDYHKRYGHIGLMVSVSNGWLIGFHGAYTRTAFKPFGELTGFFPWDGSPPTEFCGTLIIGNNGRIELWEQKSYSRYVYSQGKFVEYSESIPFERGKGPSETCKCLIVSKHSYYETVEEELLAILLNPKQQNIVILKEGVIKVLDPMPDDTVVRACISHDNQTILVVGTKNVMILDNPLVNKV